MNPFGGGLPEFLAVTQQSDSGLWFLLALPFVLIAFLTGVGMWEKRLAWPYSGLSPAPSRGSDETVYAQFKIQEARACGFRLLGWATDLKGSMYKVDYAFMASPDDAVLVVIGAGRIMNMPLQTTWMHSISLEGVRGYCTTDHQNGVHIDPTGAWVGQLIPNAGFERLWSRHRALITERGVQPVSFVPGRELDVFRAARLAHFDELARRGIICFLDDSSGFFRFTCLGAFRQALVGQVAGVFRQLTFGRFPRVC